VSSGEQPSHGVWKNIDIVVKRANVRPSRCGAVKQIVVEFVVDVEREHWLLAVLVESGNSRDGGFVIKRIRVPPEIIVNPFASREFDVREKTFEQLLVDAAKVRANNRRCRGGEL